MSAFGGGLNRSTQHKLKLSLDMLCRYQAVTLTRLEGF